MTDLGTSSQTKSHPFQGTAPKSTAPSPPPLSPPESNTFAFQTEKSPIPCALQCPNLLAVSKQSGLPHQRHLPISRRKLHACIAKPAEQQTLQLRDPCTQTALQSSQSTQVQLSAGGWTCWRPLRCHTWHKTPAEVAL